MKIILLFVLLFIKFFFFNDFYKINDNSQHFNNKISGDRLLLTVIVSKKKFSNKVQIKISNNLPLRICCENDMNLSISSSLLKGNKSWHDNW